MREVIQANAVVTSVLGTAIATVAQVRFVQVNRTGTTKSGDPVVNFRVAYNIPSSVDPVTGVIVAKDVYMDCAAYREQSVPVASFRPGQKLCILGSVTPSSYINKNTNALEQKVVLNVRQFLPLQEVAHIDENGELISAAPAAPAAPVAQAEAPVRKGRGKAKTQVADSTVTAEEIASLEQHIGLMVQG